MKITCQSCQAKYTIADEKVLGKVVKIRCKKCSATIVVNGNDPTAPPEVTRGYGEAGVSQEEPWTINVADGDQRTMTQTDIVAAFQAGVVTEDTYCWKDGMNDWLPLREIEALYDSCTATRAVAVAASSVPPAAQPSRVPVSVEFSGPILNTPPLAAAAGNGSPGQSGPSGAARRAGGRAPAADLFGAVAQAGSEEDVLTSAPAGMPQPHEDASKPIGARNENSVLFSLNALTSKGNGGERAPLPGSEQSGLIDIRQLSAQVSRADDKKSSRVDDIMNLAGGGAFSPSLGAPVLAPPPIDQYSPPSIGADAPAAGGQKNKAMIFVALGAGALVIVGAIGAATMLMHGKDTEGGDKPTASASSAEPPASAAPVASAPADTAAAPSASAEAPAETSSAKEPETAAKGPAAPAKPKETKEAPAPTHAAPPPAAVSDQPFNMGEAKGKLGAAAASAETCKKPNGPTGTGRVVVTFAPSGAVQSAAITGPPFEGTPTGACVAAHFKAVHVPAFGGSPFAVSKSFTITP